MDYILIFIFGLFLGFGFMYYAAKEDIEEATSLENLKIMYHVRK